MERKYAYVFSIGNGRVTWSGETEESLRKRVTESPYSQSEDIEEMESLIKVDKVGHFVTLPVGDMIFQIA